jgi:hypothetical protein
LGHGVISSLVDARATPRWRGHIASFDRIRRILLIAG